MDFAVAIVLYVQCNTCEIHSSLPKLILGRPRRSSTSPRIVILLETYALLGCGKVGSMSGVTAGSQWPPTLCRQCVLFKLAVLDSCMEHYLRNCTCLLSEDLRASTLSTNSH